MNKLEEIIEAVNSNMDQPISIHLDEEGLSYTYQVSSTIKDYYPEISIIAERGYNAKYNRVLDIKKILQTNISRTWLRVKSNDEDLVQASLEYIKDNVTIQKLNMVRLNNSQIKELFEAIKQNTNLYELCLRRCNIGRDEATSITNSLKDSSLKELDLEYNKFTSEGIMTLANCLKSNKTLTALDLSHTNAFTSEVERAFIEILICNTSLIRIGMSYSNIDYISKHLIQDLLKINKQTKFIKDKLSDKIAKAKLYNYNIIDKQSLLDDANLQKDYHLEDHSSLVIINHGLIGSNAGSPDG
ncbi:MAG: hypothetical protein K0R02_721 [Rickettsiaceae bacterium]|jgi:Ran GTPase-activating protein (RanGAP) involved in mRNA processing and transport|nr:hypothetical protein [Rickettsiaceae bacterium]